MEYNNLNLNLSIDDDIENQLEILNTLLLKIGNPDFLEPTQESITNKLLGMSLLKQTLLGNDVDTKTALLKLLDDDIYDENNYKCIESLNKLKQTIKQMILDWSQK
jgi:hypothetical protein